MNFWSGNGRSTTHCDEEWRRKIMIKVIDAHIHLDQYNDTEVASFALNPEIEALISVSMNLESCKRNLFFSEKFPKVKAAFGFHPEQPLPSETDLNELLSWMSKHVDKMVAVGEVGLPFFMRADKKVTLSQYHHYIEILDEFIKLAKNWHKPIALHAVYTDAPVVCDLLEKHSFARAHFHWFKGDAKTTERMIANGYFVSVTPEVAMDDPDNLNLVRTYPLNQIMVETDGPWPFEGQFAGQRTHPIMIKESIKSIAKLKRLSLEEVERQIQSNTKSFFSIEGDMGRGC